MKEKKFRYLPAFITLLAGFITSVVAIIYRFSLVRTLWTLVIIMVIFFTIGMVVRYIFSRTLIIPEEEKKEDEENKEGEGEAESKEAEPKENK